MQGIRGPAEPGEAPPTEAAGSALAAFAAAALELVGEGPSDRGLAHLLRAVALGTGAELVVARLADEHASLTARAVHSDSEALAAELQGTRIPLAEVSARELELEDAVGDPRLRPPSGARPPGRGCRSSASSRSRSRATWSRCSSSTAPGFPSARRRRRSPGPPPPTWRSP